MLIMQQLELPQGMPAAPTARAGTNMPVEAPTPFVQIMRLKLLRKNRRTDTKLNWKLDSWSSGSGSPR